MLKHINISINLRKENAENADAVASNSDWPEVPTTSSQLESSLNCVLDEPQSSRTTSASTLLFSLPLTMASRRLAFSLNQALRTKQALRSIQPLKRNFATPVEPARTECTTLSNGLTVAFHLLISIKPELILP